ncbi:hypothetical protein C8J57DRAFT_1584446 [Mycena rebaudengoi]|nr:hypothetical protein C8J57DRAFT_1584446 [Mycena rebaudengoi]
MAQSPTESAVSGAFTTQEIASTTQDIKRRPGRAKNKRKEPANLLIPKPRRGWPPGTGPKQKAAAAGALASNTDSESDEPAAPAKHLVGRPSSAQNMTTSLIHCISVSKHIHYLVPLTSILPDDIRCVAVVHIPATHTDDPHADNPPTQNRYTYGWNPINIELHAVDKMEVLLERKKDVVHCLSRFFVHRSDMKRGVVSRRDYA